MYISNQYYIIIIISVICHVICVTSFLLAVNCLVSFMYYLLLLLLCILVAHTLLYYFSIHLFTNYVNIYMYICFLIIIFISYLLFIILHKSTYGQCKPETARPWALAWKAPPQTKKPWYRDITNKSQNGANCLSQKGYGHETIYIYIWHIIRSNYYASTKVILLKFI